MRKALALCSFLFSLQAAGQELFVYTEPASTLPAHGWSAQAATHYFPHDRVYDRPAWRVEPQLGYGFSRKLTLELRTSLSDMHTYRFKWESLSIYGKFRLLSLDELHRHFRLALFGEASHTAAPFHYDEISLTGDKSGASLGIIATQLLHRVAVSASFSHTQVLNASRYGDVVYIPQHLYRSLNYSLSAGCLLLPRENTGYGQPNLNLYLEALAQQTLDLPRHYIDLAPALQVVINSKARLSAGYRFQLGGNMDRLSHNSFVVSLERSFF